MTSPSLDIARAQINGKREHQEDAYKIILNEANPTHTLCVLADGMGGHAAGEIAANLAVDTFTNSLAIQQAPCHGQFLHALDKSNRALSNAVSKNPKYKGMGCTLVGLEIYLNHCHWISVGDSPLFHIRGNDIKRINADHSMASQLDSAAKMGEITEEEARKSPSRNSLLSALTGGKISRMDYSRTPLILKEGDWLILGSDGIETLSQTEITDIIKTTPQLSAGQLLKSIISKIKKHDKSNQDNATAITIYFNQSSAENNFNDDEVKTRPIMR